MLVVSDAYLTFSYNSQWWLQLAAELNGSVVNGSQLFRSSLSKQDISIVHCIPAIKEQTSIVTVHNKTQLPFIVFEWGVELEMHITAI